MASPLVSEISFGSVLVYSPRGVSDVARRSRSIRDAIKAGKRATIREAIDRLRADLGQGGLGAVLGEAVTLVPAPRSGILYEGGLWPPRIVAEELVRAGFGKEVSPCLVRIEAVPKAAFQAPGSRPTALRHYETIRVEAELGAGSRFTIVDDFVTKGSTLLGAASRLSEAFPRARIAAFALVRTRGLGGEIEGIVEPCLGRIFRKGDDAGRDP